ncbi:SET domain-containing protein 4 isoform X2 [Trichomycterus rosablanca]|uniref:SET domain-containing protein 4 isoform X2 n=1 Tax=Trichomycterus rosablanca TaxID=2290929 RepID=UPI002F34F15F
MNNRSGRRARKKRRKKQENASNEPFVDLRRWLKQKGFSSRSLIPASFSDTGRGLMATQPVKANELVISLPERCLLTTTTVLKSYIGDYIKRWKPPVSPLVALCSFLIAERHYGKAAEWSAYIQVLPKSYTCPVYFSDDIMDLLPPDVRQKPIEELFTVDAFRWAWCSVNTRTVYMEHTQSEFLSREKDVFALAPYLDLLNHCPEVQVEAGFNRLTRCYEIRSAQGCTKYQQAFICYGPHDNHQLLLEYGFVASRNPHSVVYVDLGTLKLCLDVSDKQLQQKLLFLKDNSFLRNLTFGLDGPSWRLMTALKLLSLKPDQYSCWKSVLLGAPVSQDRKEWCLLNAQMLCQHLSNDNTDALERLTQMKAGADEARLEQLCVIENLRREERTILEHSKQVLQSLLS